MPYMTLGQERLYNPFLRLNNESVIENLINKGDEIKTERDVFVALRRHRDKW